MIMHNVYISVYIYILRKYEHNNNKSKHGTFKKSKIREVAENSANTDGGKIQSRRKGKSHRDAFRPCSRVSEVISICWQECSITDVRAKYI